MGREPQIENPYLLTVCASSEHDAGGFRARVHDGLLSDVLRCQTDSERSQVFGDPDVEEGHVVLV